MKKHIPNGISLLRALGAVLLCMFQPFSAPYWIVYLLCGISDAADGFLARRLHAETMFGAVLDSTADFLLIAFAALTLLPQLQPAPWMIAWAAGIAALRVTALLVCRIRFHRCAVCHTISNRASGFALFLLPILWRSCGNWLIAAVGGLATLAACEELLLQLTAKRLNLNRKSILPKQTA